MERKFVRGYAKNKVCSAEIMPEKEGLYRVILRGTTFKNNKINPIELFAAKDAQN